MTFPVLYVPDYLTREFQDEAFKLLRDNLEWERRETAPRYEYWTNLFDQSYTYGRGAGVRTYESRPTSPMIEAIAGLLVISGEEFEGCFLNMYKDGRDALGWHADDDPWIDHTKPIAVVTLYNSSSEANFYRSIEFKNKETGESGSQILEPGSLLMMAPGMQQTYFHRIPKAGFICPPRISLTFRGLGAWHPAFIKPSLWQIFIYPNSGKSK